MSRSTASASAAASSSTSSATARQSARPSGGVTFDAYQVVTDRILTLLDQGVAPWRSPILGRTSAGFPKNLNTGRPYRGVNVFLLAITAWVHGYDSSYWLTFNQVKQRGGSVRKGEKSSMVVFWKPYETTDKQTGEAIKVPVLRHYNVFNAAAQCDGIEVPDKAAFTPSEFHPIESAAAMVAAYLSAGGPSLAHGGASAFYRPRTDAVQMPDPTRFDHTENYYSTLLHELAHSTGHSSRLDRKLDTDPRPFGSPDYGREELVAEMAAAFLCGEAGIVPAVIDSQAAYLQGWIKTLKGDKRLVVAAAGAAQKAADWILGRREVVAAADETPEGAAD